MARAMKVAIVDDEADMRASISQWLALSGFDTETYPSAEDALKSIGADFSGDAFAPSWTMHGSHCTRARSTPAARDCRTVL